MQTEACRWYEKGLEKQIIEGQQTQLQLANGKNVDNRLGVAAICAPVLFSLFECLMTTSFAAWASHARAAVSLLEMRGPKNCQTGLIHHLFRTARLGAVSFAYRGLHIDTEAARSTSVQHLNSGQCLHRTNGAPFHIWATKRRHPIGLAIFCSSFQALTSYGTA